jgi:hypothetical protein
MKKGVLALDGPHGWVPHYQTEPLPGRMLLPADLGARTTQVVWLPRPLLSASSESGDVTRADLIRGMLVSVVTGRRFDLDVLSAVRAAGFAGDSLS